MTDDIDKDDHKILWSKVGEKRVKLNPYHHQMEKHYVLPNGNPKIAYTAHHKPFVIGMALTPENQVILVREYRPGPEKVMLDMPCGSMNTGEDPIDAMRRELEEETGYTGDPVKVNTSFTGPYSNQLRHTFIVRNCRKIGPQKLDHDEFINVVTMDLREFFEVYVLTGQTSNAAAVLYCLDHLDVIGWRDVL